MSEIFKNGQRIKSKLTGQMGTITLASPFTIRVIWDDYKDTMKKHDRTPSSMVYKIDKAKKLFEPVLDEFAGTDVFPANGHGVMGSIGDASFIGPEGQRKGAPRTSVYKTPKSSVHYKKGKFPQDPDYYDEDNWETDQKKSYINDKSVPKTSIHSKEFNEQLGMPVAADGTIDGGPRCMDPIAKKTCKKKKFTDASKYGYPKTENINEALYTAQYFRDLANKKLRERFSDLTEDEFNKRQDELIEIMFKEEREEQERLLNPNSDITVRFNHGRMVATFDSKEDLDNWIKKTDLGNNEYMYTIHGHGGEIDLQKYKKSLNDSKDYDDNIVPKTSIHYGERDKVKGQPKMEFKKKLTTEDGLVPNDLKNIKTQGDWKSNLTKAVMDLTAEAQPEEPVVPVPKVKMEDTPEFPYKNETDGSMVYPIPGTGVAIKKGDEWTFGDTPPLPATAMKGMLPANMDNQAFGEPADNTEIDIPCTKRPLIKKLLMFLKGEQSHLHEGVALNGMYNGKMVKLNTIFEGEERRFKVYVKTNEGKTFKVHFGPKSTDECESSKRKEKSVMK